jgi:polyvinyl alcohol dehydrogenase (cytochrome)
VVAVNATNGHIIWKTYTVPPNSGPCTHDDPTNGPSGCGFSGGAVWATPTVDPQTNQVFVGTGNNYTATDAANACETNAEQTHTSDSSCTPPNDYFDSVLALNMSTGKIDWGDKVQGWDAWNVACAYGAGTWCPSIYSPDWDFGGSSPNLFTGAGGEKLVGDGQKSGVYWAIDEKTGKIVWHTLVGPGSSFGGIEWGSAFDGTRIYVAIANAFQIPYTFPTGGGTHGGSWAALDPVTGKILWQTAVPGNYMALGAVSSANGVVYGGSMDTTSTDSTMFALNASSGSILWSYAAGSSVNAAPAIVNGTVYWGSGYSRFGPYIGTGNDKFYAFSINGQ